MSKITCDFAYKQFFRKVNAMKVLNIKELKMQ